MKRQIWMIIIMGVLLILIGIFEFVKNQPLWGIFGVLTGIMSLVTGIQFNQYLRRNRH